MVIEPIPHADEAEIAEQARPVDDGIEECRPLPKCLGENPDADAADAFESVWGQNDDHPPAAGRAVARLVSGRVFWPSWGSNPFTRQRSFVEDMASLNEPYRPDW